MVRFQLRKVQKAKLTLKTREKNNDGKISGSELGRSKMEAPAASNPMADRPTGPTAAVSRLRELDANGDGKVTRSEIPIRMQRILDRADSNGDDALDMQEIEDFGQNLGRGRPN